MHSRSYSSWSSSVVLLYVSCNFIVRLVMMNWIPAHWSCYTLSRLILCTDKHECRGKLPVWLTVYFFFVRFTLHALKDSHIQLLDSEFYSMSFARYFNWNAGFPYCHTVCNYIKYIWMKLNMTPTRKPLETLVEKKGRHASTVSMSVWACSNL